MLALLAKARSLEEEERLRHLAAKYFPERREAGPSTSVQVRDGATSVRVGGLGELGGVGRASSAPANRMVALDSTALFPERPVRRDIGIQTQEMSPASTPTVVQVPFDGVLCHGPGGDCYHWHRGCWGLRNVDQVSQRTLCRCCREAPNP